MNEGLACMDSASVWYSSSDSRRISDGCSSNSSGSPVGNHASAGTAASSEMAPPAAAKAPTHMITIMTLPVFVSNLLNRYFPVIRFQAAMISKRTARFKRNFRAPRRSRRTIRAWSELGCSRAFLFSSTLLEYGCGCVGVDGGGRKGDLRPFVGIGAPVE